MLYLQMTLAEHLQSAIERPLQARATGSSAFDQGDQIVRFEVFERKEFREGAGLLRREVLGTSKDVAEKARMHAQVPGHGPVLPPFFFVASFQRRADKCLVIREVENARRQWN